MANWNLQKQNQLHALQEDQRIFYSSILPALVKTFQSMLGSAVDIQMVADMILNATEIRALLKDWDRTANQGTQLLKMPNLKVIPMSKAYFFILSQIPSMAYPSIDDCIRALKSRLAYDMPLRKAKIPLYSVDSTLDVRLVRYYSIGEGTMNKICTSRYLKSCELWPDSLEQSDWKWGDIRLYSLILRKSQLETYDDLTPAEQEYLQAIIKTIDDPAGNKHK